MIHGPRDFNGPSSVLEMLLQRQQKEKLAQDGSEPKAAQEPEPEQQDPIYSVNPFESPEISEKEGEEISPYATVKESLPSKLVIRTYNLKEYLGKPCRVYFAPKNSLTKVFLSEEELSVLVEIETKGRIRESELDSPGNRHIKEKIDIKLKPVGLVRRIETDDPRYVLNDYALSGNYVAEFKIRLVSEE